MVADLDGLVRLEKSRIKAAGEVLARAFQDDPIFIHFIPDVSQRKNKLSYLMQFLTRYAVLHGEVYATSPNLEGVATWLPSEKTDKTLWRMIMNGGLSLYVKLGGKVISRRGVINDYISSIHKHHAPFRHWYLELIGVEPELQGNGYASLLLKAMLARLDKERLPCFLETQNGDNIPFYRRFGFKVVEEVTIPGTALKHWALLRGNTS